MSRLGASVPARCRKQAYMAWSTKNTSNHGELMPGPCLWSQKLDIGNSSICGRDGRDGHVGAGLFNCPRPDQEVRRRSFRICNIGPSDFLSSLDRATPDFT